jgi:hypothetical protein
LNGERTTDRGRAKKWGKFSEHDLSELKGNDDLVTQLAAKYGLDKAQRDVDNLMKGRQF